MEEKDIRYGLPDFGSELELTTSLSSGKGGQHVNKTETRVELRFNVFHSNLLSEAQREQLINRLSNRISREGYLRMYAQKYRSQLANRNDVLDRFYQMLAKALKPKKPRIKIRVSPRQKAQRLDEKKSQSLKKELRKPPDL
ncbi:MAG: alternative ribosome rescue aminoacyl-tRNA hydrolase ArfB [Lentimicrobium sp.]|jgi:ribosome-associated protein|nr:alternative ribosome rescue aminoacyl-tRNA hydrolase ArfB [Lentimicrobium sp.]